MTTFLKEAYFRRPPGQLNPSVVTDMDRHTDRISNWKANQAYQNLTEIVGTEHEFIV